MQVSTKDSLDGLLAAIPEGNEFCVLLEDWNNGLLVEQKLSGKSLRERAGEMRKSYGDNFALRAFNRDLDLGWNGDIGLIVTPEPSDPKPVSLPLISLQKAMHKQYPAATKLAEADVTRVDAVVSASGELMRFVGLTDRGRGEA